MYLSHIKSSQRVTFSLSLVKFVIVPAPSSSNSENLDSKNCTAAHKESHPLIISHLTTYVKCSGSVPFMLWGRQGLEVMWVCLTGLQLTFTFL